MDSMDLDTRIAEATAVLEKVAQETGVDLDSLSTEDLEGALADIMGIKLSEDASTSTPEPTPTNTPAPAETKQASAQPEQPTGLRLADVGVALSKYAASENIDLSKLSAEEYGGLWDQMVEYLSSPAYEQDKTAAAEMQSKLAEADVTGRQFAIAFWDQLQKLSAEEEKNEEKKDEDGESAAHERSESKSEEKEEEKKAAFMDKVKDLAASGKALAKSHGTSLATRMGEAAGAGKKTQLAVGKNIAKAVGATGAAGAAATGAAYMAGKSRGEKEAAAELDAMVTERARQLCCANGINPDSGAKFASDAELIDFLAMEKIRAAGIEVG